MSYTQERICIVCGERYTPVRKDQRCCSHACNGQHRHVVASVSDRPFNHTSIKKTCPVCGKEYWEYKSRKTKTCSRKCTSILLRGVGNPMYKEKQSIACWNCGIAIEIQPCLKNRKHFCSDKCKYEWRSKNIVGNKVHNWLGGKSFGKYCEKFNFGFKERVRIFFKRKCFECGCYEVKERHHIHHIHFNPSACCDNSEHEFVPLCRSCHAITTNSINRSETSRYLSMRLNMTTGGKCYYSKEELKELHYKLQNLDKMSRWELSHLML
jgi:predicted nucleic acid-binding Zn ribbon protein